LFSYVNSYIPYEKQVFAAAHELYHIWFDEEVLSTGELLKSEVIDAQFNLSEINEKEAKANRFAAMLLVPKDVLRNELDYMRLTRDGFKLSHIVKLMSIFGVPYKTMVRRLYEIDFIEREICLKLLEISDRDEISGVLLCQKRLQIGEELQKRTKVIRFDGLVDNALLAFERKKISEDKLTYLLAIARTTPEAFGISPNACLPNEEELLNLIEEEKDD
jgi:Zn-dependent peptidase ImmA (M78 family)